MSPPGVSGLRVGACGPVLCLPPTNSVRSGRPVKFRLVPLAAMVVCSLALDGLRSMHMPNIWPFHKKPKPGPRGGQRAEPGQCRRLGRDLPAILETQHARHRPLGRRAARAASPRACRRKPPGRCASRCVCVRAASSRSKSRARSAMSSPVAPEGTQPIDLEFAPSVYRPTTAAIYISWGSMPVFAEVPVAPESPGFVSPTEVPKTVSAARARPPIAAPSASDIVPPAKCRAQPSPPPGILMRCCRRAARARPPHRDSPRSARRPTRSRCRAPADRAAA